MIYLLFRSRIPGNKYATAGHQYPVAFTNDSFLFFIPVRSQAVCQYGTNGVELHNRIMHQITIRQLFSKEITYHAIKITSFLPSHKTYLGPPVIPPQQCRMFSISVAILVMHKTMYQALGLRIIMNPGCFFIEDIGIFRPDRPTVLIENPGSLIG